jgi:enoyl-CoA hydratase
MTGNFVDAATALRIGLVNHVKPADELLGFAFGLARAIAEADPAMIGAMRRDWDENVGLAVGDGRRVHRDHAIKGGFGGNRGADIAGRRESVLARSRDQRGVG